MTNASVPICFGKSWEANHPECNGGLDATYTHPQRKDHRRDRCNWYSTCASRTSAGRLGQPAPAVQVQQPQQFTQVQQQIIPVQQLVRPQQPSMPSMGQQVLPQAQPVMNRAPQPGVATHQAYMGHPQPMLVHPSTASMPWMVPMNFQMPGSQMPAYLTVPEPVVPGRGTFIPLMYTILRSVLKAGSHSIANFYDHVPLGHYPNQDPDNK